MGGSSLEGLIWVEGPERERAIAAADAAHPCSCRRDGRGDLYLGGRLEMRCHVVQQRRLRNPNDSSVAYRPEPPIRDQASDGPRRDLHSLGHVLDPEQLRRQVGLCNLSLHTLKVGRHGPAGCLRSTHTREAPAVLRHTARRGTASADPSRWTSSCLGILHPMTDANGTADDVELSEETRRAVDEALWHADDLVAAARKLDEYPHLAYHLGVLGLEEIGRSALLVMRELAARRQEGRRFERESEDHVRKLFWALWGPSFGRDLITREQIEEFQGLAQAIHDTRKSGIYVDPEGVPPRDAVTAEEAEHLLGLAEARLGMARNVKWAPLDRERAGDMRWFMDATADPEARTQIMGGASMNKLSELGNVLEWIRWLRQEFETAEREAIELAERELAREEPGRAEELEPKWRIKLRLFSGSHSIRPQPLTWWNEISDWIKLHPVGSDHRQLLVELTVPKRISVHSLWDAGFSVSKQIVLALNIGSSGFVWWYLPEHISRFYEQLTDLEANERLVIERSPRLRVDWGNNVLSQSVLTRVAMCIHSLPRGDEREKLTPFDNYLTGLGFLSKTDIFMQFEANAFERFYLALKKAMNVYGDWDESVPFPERFEAFASEFFTDEGDRETYIGAAETIEAGAMSELRVDLSQAAMMKVLTDAYLLRTFDRLAHADRGDPGDR